MTPGSEPLPGQSQSVNSGGRSPAFRKAILAELITALAVLAAATALGTYATIKAGFSPEYFLWYRPAVSLACGGPFADLAAPTQAQRADPVSDFLAKKTDRFDCSQLPRDYEALPLSGPKSLHSYAIFMWGMIWKVTGPSWGIPADVVFGAMFGITAVLVYGLARFFLKRWLAVLVGLSFATGSSNLMMLAYFRDYSRAPFVLTALLLLAALCSRRWSFRASVAIGLAAGFVTGIGLGFRTDLLAVPPLFVIAAVFIAPSEGRLIAFRRWVPAFVYLAAFVVASFPVLVAYFQQRFPYGNFHRAEGTVEYFNSKLGLKSPFYDQGLAINDAYSQAVIASYAARSDSHKRPGDAVAAADRSWDNFDLNGASSSYNSELVRNFPADFLVRSYASVARVATLPMSFSLRGEGSVWGVRSRVVDVAHRVIVNPLWIPVAALGVLFMRNRRLAFLLALVIVYFGLVNTVQFSLRHVFYFEFLFWICAAVLAGWLSEFIIHRLRREPSGSDGGIVKETGLPSVRDQLRPVLLYAAICLAVMATGLAALVITRIYQRNHVHHVVEQILADAVPITPTSSTAFSPGTVLIKVPVANEESTVAADADPFPQGRYLVISFGGTSCGQPGGRVSTGYKQIKIEQDYEAAGAFERTFNVKLRNRTGTSSDAEIVLPVFRSNWVEFTGFQMESGLAQCIKSFAEVTPDRGPDLMTFFLLNPGWKDAPAYLRFE